MTTDGIWILCDPVFAIAEQEGAATLGQRIEAALDGSRLDVSPPISEDGGRVTLVPTRNLGPRDGFEPSTKLVFTTLDDPEQLGALAAEVLRAST